MTEQVQGIKHSREDGAFRKTFTAGPEAALASLFQVPARPAANVALSEADLERVAGGTPGLALATPAAYALLATVGASVSAVSVSIGVGVTSGW
jgi:hypothetical protein